jgi:hypothetical protein
MSIGKAKTEIKAARLQQEQLEARIQELEQYIRIHQAFRARGGSAGKREKSQQTLMIADAVARYLSDGGPLKTPAIVEKLRSEGVSIPGSNHAQYVSQILHRDGRFKSNRAEGWSLITTAKVISMGKAS